jgi:hypothetical protein
VNDEGKEALAEAMRQMAPGLFDRFRSTLAIAGDALGNGNFALASRALYDLHVGSESFASALTAYCIASGQERPDFAELDRQLHDELAAHHPRWASVQGAYDPIKRAAKEMGAVLSPEDLALLEEP